MEHPDEQESQIDFMAVYTDFGFSPGRDQGVHPDQQLPSGGDSGDDGNKMSDDHSQVIPESMVGETQYASLEPDTQANQDSMISRVSDTQFDSLEAETQAAGAFVPVPASEKAPADEGIQLATNTFHMEDRPLLKRPELPGIENAGSGFKFSAAKPRTQNPAKRPEPKHSSRPTEMKVSSVPESALAADLQSGSSRTPTLNTKVSVDPCHSAEEPSFPVLDTHDSIDERESRASRHDTASRSDRTQPEISEDVPRVSTSVQHNGDVVQRKSHASDPITTEPPSSAIYQSHVSAKEPSVQPRRAQELAAVTVHPVQLVSRSAVEPTNNTRPTETSMPSLPQSGPLTPLKSAQNARPVQRKLSRGRRLKKPFPEATTPEDSRRWGEKTPAKPVATAPPNNVDSIRSGTPSNTGRARYSTRDDDLNDNENGRRQRSVSVATSEHAKLLQQCGTGSYAPTHSFTRPHGETSDLPSYSNHVLPGNEYQTAFDATSRTDPHVSTLRAEHDLHGGGLIHHAMVLDHTPLPATPVREEHEGLAMEQHANADDPRGDSNRHSAGARQNLRVVRQPTLLHGDDLQNLSGHPTAHSQYQAASGAQSRPQSRRSDCPQQVSRPLSIRDLRTDDPPMLHATHANKVRKTSKSNKQNTPVDRPQSPKSQLESDFSASVIMQMHRQSGDGLYEVVQKLQAAVTSQESSIEKYKACITSQNEKLDEQKARIKSQDTELDQLRIASEKTLEDLRKENTTSKEKIRHLEQKHEVLSQIQQKLKEQAKKYALHMNDVVNAQKWCKAKAEVIRKQTSDAIESCAEGESALAKVESARANLESAVKNSKEFRLTIQKLETVKKEKQELIAANNRLLADKEKHMQDVKAFEMQLQEVQSQHESEKASLVSEKDTLHANAENVLKNYQFIKSELDDRLKDLSAERHQNEQLRKNLSDQTTTWGQLLELVKQVPLDTAEIINADDGKVATLLSSEHTSHQKLEEMTTMIKELAKRETELPPTLVKLIEDISLRLEGEKQLSDGNNTVLRDTAATISQELKDGLNQLRLDKEAEIRFNTKISELEQVRKNLKAQKVASDTEVENLSRQLEESRQELSTCRSDLNNKNNELSAALNVPREDPALRIKISELEKANTALDNQAKEARQELSRANEELVSAREVSSSKEEENKTLTQKLSNVQQSLKNFNEDKAKALALQEQQHKNNCQSLAKNMEAQKSTIKVKLEAEVKTLELRVTERNAEIDSLKEELRISQAEAQKHNTAKLEAEIATYKDQVVQLVTQLKRLEQDRFGNQNTSQIVDGLRSAQKELAGIRTLFQSATADTTLSLEVATREQRAIEETLRRIDETQGRNLATHEGSSSFRTSVVSRSLISTESPARPRAAAHALPQQHHELESRTLRSAPRKSNWRGGSMHSDRSNISTPQSAKHQESIMSRTSASITPAGPQSSPLSDLSPMFAKPGPAHNQVHSRKGYDPQTIFAQQTVLGLAKQGHHVGDLRDDSHQPGTSIMTRPNAPSNAEESHRRRTSMPPKSVLKKSTRSNRSLPEGGAAGADQDSTVRITGTKNNSMGPPPVHNRPLIDNFQGVVSGRSARAATSNRPQALNNLTPDTPGASHFFDVQNSPPMDAPKRNRSKRMASTALQSQKSKAPRLGVPNRFSARKEIPDSQADSQDSTYY